jgi:hypothetical protein
MDLEERRRPRHLFGMACVWMAELRLPFVTHSAALGTRAETAPRRLFKLKPARSRMGLAAVPVVV